MDQPIDFIETHTSRYPYRMLHDAECKVAARATYRDGYSISTLAEKTAGNMPSLFTYYRGAQHDACMKPDKRQALSKAIREVSERRKAAQDRRSALIDAAVAQVANEALLAAVGDLTEQEQAQYAAMVSQLKSGTFRPHSVRDLRKVAISDASV